MKNVTFVAPFLAETTLRFVSALARLGGSRTTLITQDAPDRVPEGVAANLAGYIRVPDALSAAGILPAVERVQAESGPVDRLLGTLEELQVPLAELREHLHIVGMTPEAARNFRDKSRMKRVLRDHGLPCARHALAHSPNEAEAFVREVGYPVIVKPKEGSGSRGTYRLDSDADLWGCLHAMPPGPDRPLMFEEFVAGEEHSFDSVMVEGRLVWHSINDYLPGALDVVEEPWIQWCVLLPREVDDVRYTEIRAVAGRALSALGMESGISHMEWFARPDGSVAISEVGARPPGARFVNLISWAHDFDLFAAWARLAVHDEFEPKPRPFAAGAAYLRGQGSGRVARVRGAEEALSELREVVVEARLPQPGQATSGTYEGEGYVIVRHPETSVVREALQRIVSTIRVELE